MSLESAEISVREKKDNKVVQEILEFNVVWFTKVFKKYPLLLKFLAKDIQISSDQTDPTKSPSDWQKILYEALKKMLTVDNISRHYELERTILSIMFFEALQHPDEETLKFVKRYGSDLNLEDLKNIRALLNPIFVEISDEDKENIILSLIFGDMGKLNDIRKAFEKYDLVTQDQDLAHDYMLGLKTELLSDFFKLLPKQIEYLKASVFPFHLGHAVQAECTEKKFVEIATFLRKIPKKYREAVINAAIFKQIMDVTGARGQNGTILLNRAILNNYLTLKEVLMELAQYDTNPKQIYWQFATKIIRDSKINFKQEKLNQMQEAIDIDAFSKEGLIWRLVIQLRIPQTAQPEDAKRQAQAIEKAAGSALETNRKFQEAVIALREYNNSAPHTFTYGPAILSTLKTQGETLVQQGKLTDILTDAIPVTYAAIFGVIIQGMACSEYLALAKNNPDLLQSPLSFNELNKQLTADITLAPALVSGTVSLEVNEDGVVKILSPKLESKSEDKRGKAPAETKRSQLADNIAIHYQSVGLLRSPKIPAEASDQAVKCEVSAEQSSVASSGDKPSAVS